MAHNCIIGNKLYCKILNLVAYINITRIIMCCVAWEQWYVKILIFGTHIEFVQVINNKCTIYSWCIKQYHYFKMPSSIHVNKLFIQILFKTHQHAYLWPLYQLYTFKFLKYSVYEQIHSKIYIWSPSWVYANDILSRYILKFTKVLQCPETPL